MRNIKLFYFIFVILLSGCSFKTNHKIQGFSMDAPYSISAKNTTNEKITKAKAYMDNCDNVFSAYNENSLLYKLNMEKNFSLAYNKDLFDIIKIGKDYSNDVFDISIRPITKLWNFKDENTIPNRDLIKENIKKVNYNNIVIDFNSIKLLHNTEIELGAIAKGYVAEKIGSMLDDAIIDIGGTIKSTSKKNITVGLKSPDGNGIFASISLPPNKAVSTSGSYERYFIKDDKLYHHILSPKTGYPVESDIISVSVINQSATIADILSTTFFAQGLDISLANLKDSDCIFVTKDNKVYITEGVVNFKLLNKKYELK